MRRLFAQGYDYAVAGLERVISERRKRLAQSLSGKVLELGSGTGANLAYLPDSVDWTGIEPNPHMSACLAAKFPGRQVIEATAEKIPFADATFDSCLATLVLCSVDDLARSVSEIRRVLKPGGTFAFLEHVIAPPRTIARATQQVIYWPWRCLCEGCRTNRDSLSAIEASFDKVEVESYWVPWWVAPPWVRYQVCGVAHA